MTPAQRAHISAQLEALLCSRDADLIRQGCELLITLRDETLLQHLSAGSGLTDDGRLLLGTPLFGRILPAHRALIGLQLALSLADIADRRPTRLRLPFDRIGDTGAALVASAGALCALTALNLQANHIGNVGAAALASSTTLRSLRTLDLSDNHIEQKGALALAASPVVRDLDALDIRNNRFGQVGWRALRAALGDRLVGHGP